MSDGSKIEWTDATWNCVTGCTKVSPGCDHCYAETFAERWRGTPGHHFENGFDVQLRPERLLLPQSWKKPRRVFVNSMSDVFHEAVPDDFILQMFAVMAVTPRHTYQVLTKRHGRMRSLLSRPKFAEDVKALMWQLDGGMAWRRHYWPLRNVWLGVSVEDQKRADLRIPALLDTPAAVRWLSCEPLLGPVRVPSLAAGIGWLVAGGESGPGARPMHPDWARSLRDQCRAAGVPFLFKQWGHWGDLAPLDGNGVFDYRKAHAVADDGTVYTSAEIAYPDGPRYGEAVRAGHDRAHLTYMFPLGKGRAGRELDGRTWDEYPRSLTIAAA